MNKKFRAAMAALCCMAVLGAATFITGCSHESPKEENATNALWITIPEKSLRCAAKGFFTELDHIAGVTEGQFSYTCRAESFLGRANLFCTAQDGQNVNFEVYVLPTNTDMVKTVVTVDTPERFFDWDCSQGGVLKVITETLQDEGLLSSEQYKKLQDRYQTVWRNMPKHPVLHNDSLK
ncbi:MAG: hypothetical protein AB7S81_00950 [Bdellovibrionales bacterium]